MTTSPDLLALSVAAVEAAAIVPSGSDFAPRDWATYSGQYPVICMDMPREEKTSLGRNVPQFTTIAVLRITGRVKAVASAADGGAKAAYAAAWLLKKSIEAALINNLELTSVIQQFSYVNSAIKISAEGEYHIGEFTQEYGLEFYDDPENFAPPVTIPLNEVTLTVEEPAGTNEPAIDLPDLQS